MHLKQSNFRTRGADSRPTCLPGWVTALAFLATAVASPTSADWTAFNDFVWLAPPNPTLIYGTQGGNQMDPDYRITPGDTSSGLEKVTLYTSSNYPNASSLQFVDSAFFYSPDPAVEPSEPSSEQARGGFLRDYNTGDVLPVRADVSHTGTTFTWSKNQGAAVAAAPGRDAYDEFFVDDEPAIGLWGTADGNDVNGVHTVTLSNLDPDTYYDYVTYGNFGYWAAGGRDGVLWRWTKIEGHDTDGFQNLSSVDTDYATAVNVETGDPNHPEYSVGHEQRAVIRDVDDPSHYVQNSGEIWFDGWVTKFRFKPGADGTVDIVTRGINNAASMEDRGDVPVWERNATSRDLENLVQYAAGWNSHSDPAQWPADPDVLEATVGQSVANGDAADSRFYLAGFKLSEVTIPPALAGDYNGDGQVDAADYTVYRDNVGLDGSAFTDGSRDASLSGQLIGAGDYDYWVANYGSTASAEAVPEPATGVFVVAGLLIAMERAGRRRSA